MADQPLPKTPPTLGAGVFLARRGREVVTGYVERAQRPVASDGGEGRTGDHPKGAPTNAHLLCCRLSTYARYAFEAMPRIWTLVDALTRHYKFVRPLGPCTTLSELSRILGAFEVTSCIRVIDSIDERATRMITTPTSTPTTNLAKPTRHIARSNAIPITCAACFVAISIVPPRHIRYQRRRCRHRRPVCCRNRRRRQNSHSTGNRSWHPVRLDMHHSCRQRHRCR